MAIEDILKALEEQAQADIDALMSEAGEHANHILDEARSEATRIREHYSQQVEKAAEGKAAKQVNATRLAAKMAVSSVRGQGLESVFSASKEKLGTLRSQKGYQELFNKLAEEAAAGLEGSLLIHVDPADAAQAKSAISALKLDATVATDISTAGGLTVEADGGRVVRRNTLEDRLDRARQLVEADVARVLFA